MIDHAHLRPCGVGHGAGFLFVGDLTNKATGITLVVLIVLYIGSQLASSLMMSSATMDPTQRKIMLFMPLVFVLFVINFPAGVLVYWITTNTWTMAQQYVIRRRIGPVKAATPEGAVATSVVPAGKAQGKLAAGGNGADPDTANGTAGGGGLGSRLLARAGQQRQEKAAEEAKVAAPPTRATRPPQSPRKKKKRSGRRR
jgi:YidC/Oxa1 family membrane protein insertase